MSRLRVLRRHWRPFAAPPPVWFLIGVLFAGQLPGEPLHMRMFLVGLLLLAVVAGWLSRRGLSAADTALLDRLLTYVADHGGGHGPFPECELVSCASCQAAHLRTALAVSP